MSFAALEARVNAATMRRLSNAVATIGLPADAAGQTLDVIFDESYLLIDQASGVASSIPVASVQESDMPEAMIDALDRGDQVVLDINGCTYTVVEPKPDGTGWTVLRLRK